MNALFQVVGTEVSIVPRQTVIEMLEKNALLASKQDLQAGSVFRGLADDFRRWSEVAEPGCVLRAPEVHLLITRISSLVPPIIWLSEEAKKRAEAAQAPDLPRLVV